MEQLPECCSGEENSVWRLRKATNGLKQSPWAWFEKFNMVISGIGFA